MTRFAPVSKDELETVSVKARARISKDLLQEFLDSGHSIGKLNREGITSSMASLQSSLRSYIASHQVPVRLIIRRSEVYFVRTDREGEDTTAPTETKRLELTDEEDE